MSMTMNSNPKGKKRRPKDAQQKTPVAKKTPVADKLLSLQGDKPLSLQGIELNSETARKAIILSEIIGPPAAKRRRRR